MTHAHATDKAPQTKGHTIRWWAPLYDLTAALMSFGRLGGIRKEVLLVAGRKAGDSVLDVGCGTGSLALLAAKEVAAGGRVGGIDASPEMEPRYPLRDRGFEAEAGRRGTTQTSRA